MHRQGRTPTVSDPAIATGGFRRVVVWVVLILAAAHSITVALWMMPSNPIRDAVGNENVAAYVKPFFDQNWSVFAPDPGTSDRSLFIRGYVGDPGSKRGELTDWLDVKNEADKHLPYDISPPRMRSIARRLAGSMTGEMNRLSDQQRRLVLANYATTSIDELARRLEEAVPGFNAEGYLFEESRLTTLSTLIARSVWGEDVSLVQFKIVANPVPSYEDRREITYGEVTSDEVRIGWRATPSVPDDVQDAFDDYVQDGF